MAATEFRSSRVRLYIISEKTYPPCLRVGGRAYVRPAEKTKIWDVRGTRNSVTTKICTFEFGAVRKVQLCAFFVDTERCCKMKVVSIVSGRLWVSSMFRCIPHLHHILQVLIISHPTIIERSSISASLSR